MRLFALSSNPPELFLDETSVACEAYSLALTGHDLSGTTLPVIFRALVDYKHPFIIYAAAPSTACFGLDAFAVRLPSALIGLVTVLLIALAARELLPDEPWAPVVAAFALAFMPWHLQYSRMAWEAVTLVFSFTLAFWLFLRALRLGGTGRFAAAGAAVGLAAYSYTPAKLLAPSFLAAMVVTAWRARPKDARPSRELGALIAAAALVAAPMVVAQLRQWEEINTRFRSVSVFREPNPLGAALSSYASHLSPTFLFVAGDTLPRHNAPGWGQCLLATAPLVAIALVQVVGRRRPIDLFLVAWLAIYPLGGALTSHHVPHASRAILAAPLAALLTAYGAAVVLERARARRSLVSVVLALCLVSNAALYVRSFFVDYPHLSARSWAVGRGRVIREAQARLDDGRARRVVVGSALVLREDVLFHTGFDPRTYDPAKPDPRWVWLRSDADLKQVLAQLEPEALLLAPTGLLPGTRPEVAAEYPLPWPDRPALFKGRAER